jgi:hypothetical protein
MVCEKKSISLIHLADRRQQSWHPCLSNNWPNQRRKPPSGRPGMSITRIPTDHIKLVKLVPVFLSFNCSARWAIGG